MEGPTTVSALIHAATMVKAGVYLVARSYPVLIETPDTLIIIAAVGGFTALFAATMALNNTNIKRVLAYSTISQLGYMFLALGASGYLFAVSGDPNTGYMAGMSHLMNHAFFKALLFLSAGAVIHAVHTEDMMRMGGLSKKLKITSTVMLLGCISIAGIPPFSGFWSKDEILATVFETGAYNTGFYLLYAFGIIAAFITAFYMFRLWFLTFSGKPRDQEIYDHAHEAPKVMWIPLVILAVLAVGSGLAGILLGMEGTLEPAAYLQTMHIASGTDMIIDMFQQPLTYVSIVVAILGIAVAYLMYYSKTIDPARISESKIGKKLGNVLLARYGFTAGYDLFGTKVIYGIAKAVDWFDRNIIDGIVKLISLICTLVGKLLRFVQNGLVQTYASIVVVGVSLVVILLLAFGGMF